MKNLTNTETFGRPNFNRMISEIEAGNVAAVIVRDMSRLGRDYLKIGYYTEIFFMERDVRYIAINDGVDSAKGTGNQAGARLGKSIFFLLYNRSTTYHCIAGRYFI